MTLTHSVQSIARFAVEGGWRPGARRVRYGKPHIELYLPGSPVRWWKCSMRAYGRAGNYTLIQSGHTPQEAYNALARWKGLPEAPCT